MSFGAPIGKRSLSNPILRGARIRRAGLLLASGLRSCERRFQQKRKEYDRRHGESQDRQPARGLDQCPKAHNPIQDIYLRKVVGKENRFVSVAHKALADPDAGMQTLAAAEPPRSKRCKRSSQLYSCPDAGNRIERLERFELTNIVMFYLIQLLNAVQYGLLLFLLASGLTLIFGTMGVINLAHGSFYMIGAYLAYWLAKTFGSLWLALPIAIVIAFAIGLLLETTIIRRLYERDHLYQVLLTFGLILIFEELRSIFFGNEVHGVAVPAILNFSIALTETLSYPIYRLFVTAVCLAIAGVMYFVIQKTRVGMMIRAGNSNREMAASLGINIPLLFAVVFAVGVTLSAFAGAIAAPITSVAPGMGNQILIICFVVVVIGGIGSINGAMIASLLWASPTPSAKCSRRNFPGSRSMS